MLPEEVYEVHGMECRGRIEEGLRYQEHEGSPGVDVKEAMEIVRKMQVEVGGIKAEVEAKIKKIERKLKEKAGGQEERRGDRCKGCKRQGKVVECMICKGYYCE